MKLTALARIGHYYSSLQIRTKNRCCLSIPNNRHQLCYHGNADALEKCSLPQLNRIILEKLHCWFNHSSHNRCQHSSPLNFASRPSHEWKLWHLPCLVCWRELWSQFAHQAYVNTMHYLGQLCPLIGYFETHFKYAAGYFGDDEAEGLSKLQQSTKLYFKHNFSWLCRKTGLFMGSFSTFHFFPYSEVAHSTSGYLSSSFSS